MDSEVKELIEKDLALSEENNKILKKMAFSSRIALTLGVIKWVVIIASVLGVTFWLGPELEKVLNTYKGAINW